MKDLELDFSEGKTVRDDGTENRSKMEENAIYEENTSHTVISGDGERPKLLMHVPTPEGHDRPVYNDFL